MDDIDFKSKINREEFEKMAEPVFKETLTLTLTLTLTRWTCRPRWRGSPRTSGCSAAR